MNPIAVVFANHRGKTPLRASVSGTSPEHSTHPLRQPSALMMAKAAINVPAALPSTGAMASANGAAERAACSPGRR